MENNPLQIHINKYIDENFFKDDNSINKDILDWAMAEGNSHIFMKFFEKFYEKFGDRKLMYDFIVKNSIDNDILYDLGYNMLYALCDVIDKYKLIRYFLEDKRKIKYIILLNDEFFHYMYGCMNNNHINILYKKIDFDIIDCLLEEKQYRMIDKLFDIFSKNHIKVDEKLKKYVREKTADL